MSTTCAQVLLDEMEEQGYPPGRRWVVALQTAAADDADDAAADDADDAAADDADDAAAADDAADDDAADDAAALRKQVHQFLTQEQEMREGLTMVTLPGRYGYSVTLVGWLRHLRGFEYELAAGHVSIIRTSGRATLGELASRGPGDDHRCVVANTSEEIHELRVRRVRAVDAKAWAE